MRRIIKLVGVVVAFAICLLIANPQSARAANNGYRVKILKTYSNELPENPYHANLKSKAYIWASKRYPYDKQKDFQKRLYKVSKLKGVTLSIQKKASVYHQNKWATYYYVADRGNDYQGWVRPSALIKGFSPYGYQITKENWGNQTATFHAKNPKQNVYIWNWRHTKKQANLKNYPGANLYRKATFTMLHNKKQSTYYYVRMQADGNSSKNAYGYVAASQVAAGHNTNYKQIDYTQIDQFTDSTDYQNYIQNGKKQKLARSIVKLFPNSQVDLGLSRIAAHDYDTFESTPDGDSTPISKKGYADIKSFSSIQKWLYAHEKVSNATKLAGIEKLLDKEGYTANKRAAMSGYKLGIQIVNNIPGYSSENDKPTRWKGYVFILGRVDK